MPKLFGLDIGSTSIKAVEITGDKKELRLGAAGLITTPPRGLASEAELDQQLMVSTIKKLVETTKIDTKLVNISLPESQVFTRVVEMPLLTDKELISAIRWESEQYIPLPVASVSLDWEVLSRDKEKNKMDVLLVGAPTTLIAKYQKILGLVGLEVVFVETEILAAGRSLIHFSQERGGAMVIDIGANATDLGIFRDGKLVVTYTLPVSGTALIRAIAQEFGFETEQAEEYKKTYGLDPAALEGKIAAAIKPVLEAVLVEVKKAISFYQSKNWQDSEFRRIILSGGGAKLPGLVLFFTEKLGVETEIANPWSGIKVDEKLFRVQLESAPSFTIATGLALREYGK